MFKKDSDDFNVDELLGSLFPSSPVNDETLREIFDRRISELRISHKAVLGILKMSYRTLNGILDGTQKMVDFTNLIKLSTFLQLPKEQVILLLLKSLEKNFPNETQSSGKVEFIKANFDLAVLRKVGFINNVTDFDHIEERIVSFFDMRSIFEYKQPHGDAAFSAGAVKPKSEANRAFWIKAAKDAFEAINNPHTYDRGALIKYFPEIRWHSTSVELGLLDVVKELYKIGITVIFQTSLPSLHLRGATVNVNNKPCIVLTDYRGYYPTLWFALIHELFHVLFDWEEIRANTYHISDKDNLQLSVLEREREADEFARDFLFSKEKTKTIRPHINNASFVEEFAKANQVHPSFIYVFSAYDAGSKDKMAWARANSNKPDFKGLIAPLENPWDKPKPIKVFVKSLKQKLYN